MLICCNLHTVLDLTYNTCNNDNNSVPQWETAKAAFDYLLHHLPNYYKSQSNPAFWRACTAAFVPTSKQGAPFAQPSELYIEPNMDESRREHPFGIRLVWRPYA
eukprot:4387-Heterococcus_DN1.PRE.1